MENILPDFILADLYPNSLVLVERNETAQQEVAAPMIKAAQPQKWFLGNNGKKISILVKEPDAVYLNDDHLNFLTKILGACQLNMGDVAIVNTLQQPVKFSEIKKELDPEVGILFGVTSEDIQLPFTVPYYQVQPYGGTRFLLAPALTAYNEAAPDAKLEKTRLWVSLKKIFNI